MIENKNKIKLTDLIDIEFLQEFQDFFAKTMDVASIAVDDRGPITKPSNFTDFCTKYTRGSTLGLRKCVECDIRWGKLAAVRGEPVIYKCHTGLTDFAVPIVVAGKHIASILGGQVLTEPPNEEHFREVAKQLGINEDEYITALKKIKIVPIEKVESAAKFLFFVANSISKIAHKKYEVLQKSGIELFYRTISEAIRISIDIEETKQKIVNIVGEKLGADRCFIVEYDKESDKFLSIKDEYLSSDTVNSLKGMDVNVEIPNFVNAVKKGNRLVINNKEIFANSDNPDFNLEKIAIQKYQVNSSYAFPLYHQNELLGVLAIHYVKEKQSISDNEINLLDTISNQVSSAIYQAKLFKLNQIQAEREKLIGKIVTTAITTFDLNQIKHLVKEVGILTKADRCFFVEVDLENLKGKPIDYEGEYLASEDIKTIIGYEFSSDDVKTFVELYLKAGDPVFFDYEEIRQNNDKKYQGIVRYCSTFDLKSGVGIPFFYQNTLVAVLAVEYVKEKVIPTKDELDFMRILGNQTGMAYNQIKFYQEMRETLETESLLRNIIETVRSTLDIDEMKKRIVSAIGKAFNVERCIIHQVDSKTGKFKIIDESSEYLAIENISSYVGIDLEDPNLAFFKTLFSEKQEMIAPNWPEYLDKLPNVSKETKDWIRTLGIKSDYAFPIVFNDKLLATFYLAYTQNYTYLSDKDLNTIRLLTHQIAIALNQAELFFETKETAEREKLLRNIIETVRSTLDISETKQKIVEIIGETLGADRCFIMEYDKDQDKFLIVKDEYVSDADVSSYLGADVNLDVPNFMEALKKGYTVLVDNKQIFIDGKLQDFTIEKDAIDRVSVISAYGIPLFYNNEIQGVLGIHYLDEDHTVSEEEMKLVTTIANQITIALYQAKLYKLTQIQADREALLRRIIEAVRSSLDLYEVKKNITYELCRAFKADRCYFRSYDKKEDRYLPVDAEYLSSNDIKSLVGIVPEQESLKYFSDEVNKQAKGFYPILADEEFAKGTPLESYIKELGIKADYAIPIKDREDEIIWLVLHYTKENPNLSEDDKKLLETVAYQIDIAFEQIKLYHNSLKTAEKERALREITNIIRSSLNINDIKDIFVTEIGKYFNADRCFIYEHGKDIKSTTYSEYTSSDKIKKISEDDLKKPAYRYWEKAIIESDYAIGTIVFDLERYIIDNGLQGTCIDEHRKDFEIKTAIGIPLVYAEELHGALVLQFTEKVTILNESDLQFIKNLANQAAVALHQARLYKLTQIQAEREKVQRKTTEILRSKLDSDEVKKSFVEIIADYFNADRCIFTDYNPEIEEFSTFKIEKTKSPKFQSLLGKNPQIDFPEFAERIKKGKNIIIRDVEKIVSRGNFDKNIALQALYNGGTKSDYALSVKYKEQHLGMLIMHFIDKKRVLTHEEFDFLKNLRDQAGIAIHQAKLYETTQLQADRERLLREIISEVSSTFNVNEIIHTFVFEIGKIIKAQKVFFSFYEETSNTFLTPSEKFEYTESHDALKYSDMGRILDNDFPTFCEYLKTNKQIMLIPDVTKFLKEKGLEDSIDIKSIQKYNFNSAIAFPVISQDKLLGFYGIEYTNSTDLNASEIDFLITLSKQTSIAMNQAKLYETTQMQAETESLLRKVIESSRKSIVFKDVLLDICKEIIELFKVSRVSIGKISKDLSGNKFVVIEHAATSAIKTSESCEDFSAVTVYWENYLLKIGQTKPIPNIYESNLPENVKNIYQEMEVKSIICIPLGLGNIKWGGLFLAEHEKYVDWNKEQVALLETIASQIYIAIRQSELYEKEKLTAKRETLLRNIAENLRSSLDIDDTLYFICSETAKLFNVQRSVVASFIQSRNKEVFTVRKEYKKYPEMIGIMDAEKFIEFATFWTSSIVEKDDIIAYDNIDESDAPELFKDTYKMLGVKSVIGIPIKKGNDVWGVLVLSEYNEYRQWTEEEKKLLTSIADQVYIAINQAELYQDAKKTAERETLLRQIFEAMRGSLDINIIKNDMMIEMGLALNADICAILTYDSAEDYFYVDEYSEYRSTDDEKSLVGYDGNREDIKWFMDVFKHSKEFSFDNVENFIESNNLQGSLAEGFLKEYNIKSSYNISINYADSLLGYIVIIYTKTYKKFDEEELDFLRIIATQAGIALHQAKLYNLNQIQADREKMSRNIIEIMRSTMDKNVIKQQFVRSIGKYFKADRVFFSDYDLKTNMYLPVEKGAEYLSSENEKSFVGYDWSGPSSAEYIQPLLEKRELKIYSWEKYIRENPKSEDFVRLFEDADVKSSYNFPVLYQLSIIGYFCIEFTQKVRVLSDDDVNTIRSLCKQAAIALYHADMYLQAQASARSKGQCLTAVSNDFLTPLNIIMETSEQLYNAEIERDKQIEYLNNIKNNCMELMGLTNEIINVSENERKNY